MTGGGLGVFPQSPPRGQPRKRRGVGERHLPPFSVFAQRAKKVPGRHQTIGDSKTAATYSPNWWVSTIGDGELNFSVRNGKRWILTAITTVVYYLREKVAEGMFPSVQQSEFRFSLAYFSFLGKSLGQLVQVS